MRDYVMQEFRNVFEQTWSESTKSCAGSPSSSSSDNTSSNVLESNTSVTSTREKKRTRENPKEDKSNQGGKDNPKKPRLSVNSEKDRRRCACPYFKRDPRQFGVGTCHHLCAGEGWEDVARVK